MSIDSRLNAIQKQIDDNADLFQVMPDFSTWTDEQHHQYIEKWKKDFVFEHRLNSFEEAESLLKKWLSKDLISEEHYNAFIMALKDYWSVDSD